MARKEKNIHYIYKTTCNVTGRWYVGMHSTSNENDGYLGSGKRLRYSIRKHGKGNHTREILEYCDSREALVLREIEIVNLEMIQDKMCMNLKEGGQGGFISEEHKEKCNKAKNEALRNLILNDPDFRSNWINSAKKNLKKHIDSGNHNFKTFEGMSHSEETKTLMSEQRKGKGTGEANSQYGTCWITKDGVNKKVKKDELESHLYDGWITGRK